MTRRLRLVKIGYPWLRRILVGEAHPVALDVTSDAPADLTIEGTLPWNGRSVLGVIVSSETFDEVPEEFTIPELVITYTARLKTDERVVIGPAPRDEDATA